MIKKELKNKIKKKIYEFNNILSTSNIIKVLDKYGIDTNNLKDTLDIDLDRLDEITLELLDEKLEFFIQNTKNETKINLYQLEISSSINFIESCLNQKESVSKDIIDSAYLKGIVVKKYFSIENINIDDINSKEIYFVGENGEGKTILLQAILLALKGKKYLKMEYLDEIKDNIILKAKIDIEYQKNIEIKNIYAYGINRNKIHYQNFDKDGYEGLFDTSDFRKTTLLKDPIKVLESDNDLIYKFIDKLNDTIFENRVTIKKSKIIEFFENGYKIEFDKLSEGYKSSIIWLCDLVSRLIENNQDINSIEEFQAIVLIDEIDLYLHPKLKYDFIYRLRGVFKNIQFIITTHSLVSILGASKDAIFYKIYKEDNQTKISDKIDDISYYTSNILMSSPLFKLDSVTSRDYKDNISSDDYIYDKIHKKVKEKLQSLDYIEDDKVNSWLDEEFLKEFGK